METEKTSAEQETSTSKELLRVTGDGSQRAVIESIFKKPPKREGSGPRTFKIARSPLFDQIQSFLPEFQKANTKLLDQPQEKIDAMNIECTDGDSKVVEMNLLMHSMSSDSEDSDSEADSKRQTETNDEDEVIGPITAENLKLPSGNKKESPKGKKLIQVVTDGEGERSDSEMTDVSSGSGER